MRESRPCPEHSSRTSIGAHARDPGLVVVNVRDAEWWFSETRGARCAFESEYGDPPVEFAQFGINVTVLEPGQTGLYHAESNQEAFLVLSGSARCSSRTRSDPAALGLLPLSLVTEHASWARARGRV